MKEDKELKPLERIKIRVDELTAQSKLATQRELNVMASMSNFSKEQRNLIEGLLNDRTFAIKYSVNIEWISALLKAPLDPTTIIEIWEKADKGYWKTKDGNK